MSDAVTRIFEQELKRRGVAFRFDDESQRYVIQRQDLNVFLSLDNLAREYARDPDDARVTHFIDLALSGPPRTPDSWEEAKRSVLFCLEPSDHVEPADFRKHVSDRVDRVLIYFDVLKGTIDWITPDMLDGWRVTADEAEAVALSNLAAVLVSASIGHTDIDGVRLGIVTTPLPFKTALVLAPNLKEVVSPVLGWPLHAVIPDHDFLYLWDARHTTFMERLGGVVVEQFAESPHPLTTEVIEIGDEGIRAIGAF
jgi:hypothetical protein